MADFTNAATWPQYGASSQVEGNDFQRVIKGVMLGKLIAVMLGTPTANDKTTAKAIISDVDGWTRKSANLVAASTLAPKVAAGTLAPADLDTTFQTILWGLLTNLIV